VRTTSTREPCTEQSNIPKLGFTIPSIATILGVRVRRATSLAISNDRKNLSQVSLWSANAVLGTIKSPATPFTTTVTLESYEGLQTVGSRAYAGHRHDPGFGFALAANCDSIRVFIGLPFSRCEVFYTLSGSGTVALSRLSSSTTRLSGLALVTTTQPHGLAPGRIRLMWEWEPGAVANVRMRNGLPGLRR